MRKRKTTSRACSVRTSATARVSAFALALAVAALAPATAGADGTPSTVSAIFAAYAHAWHRPRDPRPFTTSGTLSGGGLTGTFRSVRDGTRLFEEQILGNRIERRWSGDGRFVERDANGIVRAWHGVLARRARTQEYIDDDAFLADPGRSRGLPAEIVRGRATHPVIVSARDGDDMTLYFADDDYRIVRVAYEEADGVTTVDYDDFRDIGTENVPFRTTVSDGDPAFDLTATIADARFADGVDPETFAIPASRTLDAAGAQTVPMIARDGHFLVTVDLAGVPYAFLLDTGASNIVVDARVAAAAGFAAEGSFEAKGAKRVGGVQDVTIARLGIGSAHLDGIAASALDTGGLRIDGILGTPFFASSLVELDFGRRTMRFGPPGSFQPRGTKVALDTDRALSEALLTIGTAHVPGAFLIDTGNGGDVLLYRGFVERHPTIVPFTASNTLTYGLGGATQTYRTKLDRLDFGGTVLRDRATDVMLATTGAFADFHDAGNIGLGVLTDFIVTFDEANDAMYLARGKRRR